MKILLVSSSSFIGKNIAKSLIKAGHELYSLDRSRVNNHMPKDKIFLYDISKPKTIIRAFEKLNNIDVCINLAGGAGAAQSSKSIYQVNYLGVKYLYKACEKYGVKKFIQFSSASVYGNVKHNQVIDENSAVKPFNNYSVAKLMADNFLLSQENSNVVTTILRLPLVYGKHTSVTLPGLVEKIGQSKFILFGRGQNIVHPLHISNLTDLIVKIVEKSDIVKSDLFLLSDDSYFELKYLIDSISDRFDYKVSYRRVPLIFLYLIFGLSSFISIIFGRQFVKRENILFYSSSRQIDNSKAKKVLSYAPLHDFKSKLNEAIDSFI